MKMLKNNKAFTLIELLVVIAILGIIVLLAVPRFLEHTEKAKLTQIKNDVRINEDMLAIRLIEEPDLIESSGWEPVEQDELQEHADLGQLYDREGVVEEVVGGQYYEVPEEEVTTNLDEKFAVARGGKLYYYGESLRGEQEAIQYTVTFIDSDGNVIEEVMVEEGKSAEAPEVPKMVNGLSFRGWDKSFHEVSSDMIISPTYVLLSDEYLGMENDFEWVDSRVSGSYYNNKGDRGYFKYKGKGQEIIEIPHVIDGTKMTSYFRMFYQAGEDVKKVISTNENVTNMREMFYESQAEELDLSSFDTSNVNNMREMFYKSQAEELDLSSFETSEVTDMSYMFWYSQATELDLSSFDTSNVTNMSNMFRDSQATSIMFGDQFDTSNITDMSYMFWYSQATELDLSSFDTSNVTNMSNMFRGSQATSIIFGDKFDTSKVTNMRGMFRDSQAKSLDLSSFDTSSVTDMSYMFYNSQATELDLSSFDTSNVTNMYSMFQDSQATELDLSSFDTSNVTSTLSMFQDSQATTGYARTQEDAKKLNETSSKPSNLTFCVKGKPDCD